MPIPRILYIFQSPRKITNKKRNPQTNPGKRHKREKTQKKCKKSVTKFVYIKK